ncbi:hypothetical protein [Nocardioides aequoreus]|uniref:hypothetical protein n=1 Tax=Nocardioides aequoreus TaxID=397278 RepID=UPI00056CC568|nr:hypothetical protein [Nocardioides aequoreus]
MEEEQGHVWGVLIKALVALALIAGAIAVGTIVMVRILGLDEGPASSGAAGGAAGGGDPLPTTALPVPGEESPSPSQRPSESESPETGLQLSVSPPQVGPNQRINLTGSYEGGDAELQVQRFENGAWVDFPVTASVTAGTFQTWIQTGRTGEQRLRMFDPAADVASNEVRVTVG